MNDDAEWCNGSTADSDSVSRGSNPFSVVFLYLKFYSGVWLSLVERYVRDVEAAGSNPVTPILRNLSVRTAPKGAALVLRFFDLF